MMNITLRLRGLGSFPKGASGQALPIAMGALALGAILITPLLTGAGTGSKATNLVGTRAKERYSMDAGIEWSGWRLLSNPQLTAVTTFTAVPLQPFPATANGSAFPATDIRFVTGAGAVEAQSPAWQSGGGVKCYTFSASEAGTLSTRITTPSGTVQVALIAAAASCAMPGGTPVGAASYGADFNLAASGTYKLVLSTTAASGTLQLSVPAATYEVRSVVGSRNVIARLVAGYSGVRVASWQLN
jgi:hypothetical protein